MIMSRTASAPSIARTLCVPAILLLIPGCLEYTDGHAAIQVEGVQMHVLAASDLPTTGWFILNVTADEPVDTRLRVKGSWIHHAPPPTGSESYWSPPRTSCILLGNTAASDAPNHVVGLTNAGRSTVQTSFAVSQSIEFHDVYKAQAIDLSLPNIKASTDEPAHYMLSISMLNDSRRADDLAIEIHGDGPIEWTIGATGNASCAEGLAAFDEGTFVSAHSSVVAQDLLEVISHPGRSFHALGVITNGAFEGSLAVDGATTDHFTRTTLPGSIDGAIASTWAHAPENVEIRIHEFQSLASIHGMSRFSLMALPTWLPPMDCNEHPHC